MNNSWAPAPRFSRFRFRFSTDKVQIHGNPGRGNYWEFPSEICIWKLENAYQWKEIEKQMTHFKSTFTTRFIKQFTKKTFFAKDACFPFTILVCLPWSFASCSLRRFETESLFCIHYMHRFHDFHTVRFLCVTSAEICVNATADCKPTAWFCRTLVDNWLFWTQKWQEHFSFLPHQTASMCWPMEIKRASWSFLPPVAPQSWSESCARTPTRNCCSQPAEYSKCSQWTLTTNRPLWR